MLAYEHRSGPAQNLPKDKTENCDIASAIHRCQSNNAKQLWIFDPVQKLTNSGTYEICGTYMDEEPELWFYCTSSVCPGGNYLLNLFFVYRKSGDVVIGVSDSDKLDKPKKGKIFLTNNLQYFSFKTTKINENHYLKTFNLPSMGLLQKENHEGNPNFVDLLVIPINISTQLQATVNTDIVNSIKIEHFKDLFNKMGQSDYTLESLNRKQYKVHKLILALRSPVLRDIISSQPTCATLDITDEDMELLLELLYNGIVKDFKEDKSKRLSDMAKHFQLNNLSSLA